jgi:hypothetical protein
VCHAVLRLGEKQQVFRRTDVRNNCFRSGIVK